jgi:hypothetical protein
MASELTCFECGNRTQEVTFGPTGFIQTCRSCGSRTDLDDVLEPLRSRRYSDFPVSIAA